MKKFIVVLVVCVLLIPVSGVVYAKVVTWGDLNDSQKSQLSRARSANWKVVYKTIDKKQMHLQAMEDLGATEQELTLMGGRWDAHITGLAATADTSPVPGDFVPEGEGEGEGEGL